MNVDLSRLSQDSDQLSLSSVTTSESGNSQKSTGRVAKQPEKKISVVSQKGTSLTLAKRSTAESSSSWSIPHLKSHKISKTPSSSKNNKISKTPAPALPKPTLEEPTAPTTYTPVFCTSEKLNLFSFNDYQNFSLDQQLGPDSLILFEENGISVWSPTTLLLLDNKATSQERKITEESNKIIAANNKMIKAHFGAEVRKEFGDRIADYFLLSSDHQTYLQNDTPLTLGAIRIVLQKAKAAKAAVRSYVQTHPELPQKVAEAIGHALFLEKESATTFEDLRKLGFPTDLLEETRRHNLEFLKAAGVHGGFLGIAAMGMLAGFVTAFHMTPVHALASVIPGTIASALTNAGKNLTANDNFVTATLIRMLNLTVIPSVQAGFVNSLSSDETSRVIPLGALSAFANTTNYSTPARYLAERLEEYADYSTPLSEATESSKKLVQSNALLEETVVLQQAAIKTYQEAALLVEKQATTADEEPQQAVTPSPAAITSHTTSTTHEVIQHALEESRQRLVALDQKRLKEQPYSPFLTSRGRFRVQF